MYRFNQNVSAQAHDAFILTQPLCNLLQTSSWAKVKENWEHKIIGVEKDEKLVASALVLIKKLPLNLCMMYIPRGIIMDYTQEELVAFTLENVRKWAKQYHCVFIKMDPCLIKGKYKTEERVEETNQEVTQLLSCLKRNGCVHTGFSYDLSATIQPRFNAMSELVEQIEETMPKRTKRHMKTAQKKHITVTRYDENMVDAFENIMRLTEERKGIKLRGADYFSTLLKTYPDNSGLFLAQIDIVALIKDTQERLSQLEKDYDKFMAKEEIDKADSTKTQIESVKAEIVHLETCLAQCGEKPYIAACLSIICGDVCEMLYMGMDDRFKKYMAPYLTHITPMKWAYERGCKWANMGGVEGTLEDGLTKFKANFNPYIFEYIGEFNIPVSKLLYKPFLYLYNKRKGTD